MSGLPPGTVLGFLQFKGGWYAVWEIGGAIGMADSYVAERLGALYTEGKVEARQYGDREQWRAR